MCLCLQCAAVCCSVLQCAAACCSVVQYRAARWSKALFIYPASACIYTIYNTNNAQKSGNTLRNHRHDSLSGILHVYMRA